MKKGGGIMGIVFGSLALIGSFMAVLFGAAGSALGEIAGDADVAAAGGAIATYGWILVLVCIVIVVVSIMILNKDDAKTLGIALAGLSAVGIFLSLGNVLTIVWFVLCLVGGILVIADKGAGESPSG